MAIDYKREWDRLHCHYGSYLVRTGLSMTPLNVLMNKQIADTINKREKLMEEYVKKMITTNIFSTNKEFHKVQIYINGVQREIYFVSKQDFNAWCKKKRKEVK